MKKILNSNIFYTILYAIFTLIIVLHHEIWADEAQFWLVVKNLSVVELFKHLVNEGHPAFFYLINMPFAKLGCSIFVMQFICWFASCTAVYLFLRFSPFNRWAKFAVVTSAGFLYFFPVIARSYSIIPLLVFVLAVLYPKSDKHPFWYAFLLFITANTHIIMFGFCGLLALEFLYRNIIKSNALRNKTGYIALGVMLFGLAAVVLQLHGTTSSNVYIKIIPETIVFNIISVAVQFFVVALDSICIEIHSFSNFILDAFFGIVSAIIYIVLFVLLFIQNKKLFFIAILGIGFQLAIYIIAYPHWVFATRIFCAHLILLFCLWVLFNNEQVSQKFKKWFNILLTVFFLITFFNGLRYSILDYRYNYSSAKDTAEYIIKNINPEDSVIVSDNVNYVISIIFYLHDKNKIFQTYTNEPIKYVVWNENLKYILHDDEWNVYVKDLKTKPDFKDKTIYIILPFLNVSSGFVTHLSEFEAVYISSIPVVSGEGFALYKYVGK